MKLSLVATVLNEENTVGRLIESLVAQTKLPQEVIFVDGGSNDRTTQIILQESKKNPILKIKLIKKNGNRSVGRNEGIRKAKGSIILSTDAGCVLDKNWVKNITVSFKNFRIDVVAGYYKGEFKNLFQKSLIPYVLVMEDKINVDDFLPATRSMAFRKSVWEKLGGFDEGLSHNEDYAFANKLRNLKYRIKFKKNAIVFWFPRTSPKDSFIMFFRFAFGDIQTNILRNKVVFIFLRYIFASYLLFLNFIMKSYLLTTLTILLFISYILWSIYKNYKYVGHFLAFYYLPFLQITSDIAVILGTLMGSMRKIPKFTFLFLKDKYLLLIILAYIGIELSMINRGIPNENHPFTYFMDEWHFSQSFRTLFIYGTGTVSGAANIPFYHIISSIIFIIPFYVLNIINPLSIKSSLDNISDQHNLFIILRLHTLFYGILSISVLYMIIKKYILKSFPSILVIFFAFSPIWILLSNFYKYDITLSFWIITTIYFIIKFNETKKFHNYLYAGISSALAISTKFTAGPLLIGYFLAYFILRKKKNIKEIILCLFVIITIFGSLGIPDLILGKGNYYELLYSTLIKTPKESLNYYLGSPSWFFLIFKEFPLLFGYSLILMFFLSLLYWTTIFLKKIKQNALGKYGVQIFLYITFIFFLVGSLSFGIDGGGNRALVLLPFMILILGYFLKDLSEKYFRFYKLRKTATIILLIFIFIQLYQSFALISPKLTKDPRATSSEWIIRNIPPATTIGIQNIPIYQFLPDVILKEFYLDKYNKSRNNKFKYKIVDSRSTDLPKVIIISNSEIENKYVIESDKKNLIARLVKEGYKKISEFKSNLSHFNILNNELDLYISGLAVGLNEISVYKKNKNEK